VTFPPHNPHSLKNLGADVGDTVLITRSGGGSFRQSFDLSKPHKITGINSSGYVEFDHGEAHTFRPDVKVI
jgi:ABC-type lipoprotein release transport system permease subunit